MPASIPFLRRSAISLTLSIKLLLSPAVFYLKKFNVFQNDFLESVITFLKYFGHTIPKIGILERCAMLR